MSGRERENVCEREGEGQVCGIKSHAQIRGRSSAMEKDVAVCICRRVSVFSNKLLWVVARQLLVALHGCA